jgi:hypothetical protein
MLEAIGAGSAKRMGSGDWAEKWRNLEELLPSRSVLIQLYPFLKERATADLLSLLFITAPERRGPHEVGRRQRRGQDRRAVRNVVPVSAQDHCWQDVQGFLATARLRIYSTLQPVNLRHPFSFSAWSRANVSIPSSIIRPFHHLHLFSRFQEDLSSDHQPTRSCRGPSFPFLRRFSLPSVHPRRQDQGEGHQVPVTAGSVWCVCVVDRWWDGGVGDGDVEGMEGGVGSELLVPGQKDGGDVVEGESDDVVPLSGGGGVAVV